MPTFVISYDLNKQKNYQKLWDELKRLACVRALESVWVGNITGTAESVKNHFTQFVDGDDSILVAETEPSKIAFKRPYQEAIDWKQQRA
jgi:hypothetical protein